MQELIKARFPKPIAAIIVEYAIIDIIKQWGKEYFDDDTVFDYDFNRHSDFPLKTLIDIGTKIPHRCFSRGDEYFRVVLFRSGNQYIEFRYYQEIRGHVADDRLMQMYDCPYDKFKILDPFNEFNWVRDNLEFFDDILDYFKAAHGNNWKTRIYEFISHV